MRPDQVTAFGADYSATEYTPEELDRYPDVDLKFLFRYIGYPSNRKCISYYPGAYQAHVDAGRPVGLYHQIGYTEFSGGFDAGRANAITAMNDAKSDRVGWDGESPILACFDRFMVKTGYATIPLATVREYVRGFYSVLGSVSGFYGFYDTMGPCVAEDWVPFRMQCGARSAHIPGIQLWQENNQQPYHLRAATDRLEAYVPLAQLFGGTDVQLTDMVPNYPDAGDPDQRTEIPVAEAMGRAVQAGWAAEAKAAAVGARLEEFISAYRILNTAVAEEFVRNADRFSQVMEALGAGPVAPMPDVDYERLAQAMKSLGIGDGVDFGQPVVLVKASGSYPAPTSGDSSTPL